MFSLSHSQCFLQHNISQTKGGCLIENKSNYAHEIFFSSQSLCASQYKALGAQPIVYMHPKQQ